MADDDLAMRLQSLPPELYHEIYRLVFTAATGERHITESYKPPKLLAIDRASRELYAKSYYGGANTSFICDQKHEVDEYEFLRPLQQSHRDMIRELKIINRCWHPSRVGPYIPETVRHGREIACRDHSGQKIEQLVRQGLSLREGIVRVVGCYESNDGWEHFVEV